MAAAIGRPVASLCVRLAWDTCATTKRSKWDGPIAIGVIEGACRHLIADRFDLAGTRWGLAGAEAVLKLRALTANGHLDDYWRYYLVHQTD